MKLCVGGLQKDIDKSLDAVSLLTTCSGKPGYIVGHTQCNLHTQIYICSLKVRFAGPASDPAYKWYYPGYTNG